MPRPPFKRRKSNSKSPTHLRRAPTNIGQDNNLRVKLQDRLANKPIAQRQQDSDDSDRLVTRTRQGRKRAEPIYASGGVAKGDTPGVFPSKQERVQRLRSDTREIVRRSRSTSATKEVGRKASVLVPSSQASNPISPQNAALPKPQATPLGETSILGTLKPRKRQHSILHMIDNNDSSIINPEDEERFLPDDESTPAHLPKKAAQPSKRLSLGSVHSASRKRKLGSDEPIHPPSASASALPGPQLVTESHSPQPLPTPSSRKRPAPRDEEDILAPPQSSSPESTPQKPKSTMTQKSRRPQPVPTTEQLQALMPAKRRRGARDRKAVSVFDIPEDSNSNSADEIDDTSVFLPRKRNATATTKKSTSKAQPKTAPGKAKSKQNLPNTVKPKPTKSTSTLSTTPKQNPRTPLPLTRNQNQENKHLSSRTHNATTSTPKPISMGNERHKSSGGSLLPIFQGTRRGLRSARGTTIADDPDKENRGIPRSLRKSGLLTDNHKEQEDVVSSVEVEDVDMIVDDGENDGESHTPLPASVSADLAVSPVVGTVGKETQAWKSKWGDIDQWSLDYEEVDVSTGSSSPLMKVSVV